MSFKQYAYRFVVAAILGCFFSVTVGKSESYAATGTSRSQVMPKAIGIEDILGFGLTEAEYLKDCENADPTLYGYRNLGIANVENNLNIREAPEDGAHLVGKLPRNAACNIISDEGEWAQIESGKVSGFVKKEYLFTGAEAIKKAKELITKYAKVTADALKVRLEPNTDAEVYTMVANGEKLEYVQTLDSGWIEVLLDDETVYVSGDYVSVEETLDTAVTMSELLYGSGVSDVRVSICEYAKQYVGNRYVYGGSSLTKGTDCSGFTMRVFQNFGIKLPHSSRAQANMGSKIKPGEAKPGDLFFYGGKGGSINHVALYIGGGQVVHASSPKTGIKISSAYYRTPVKVVRILQYD